VWVPRCDSPREPSAGGGDASIGPAEDKSADQCPASGVSQLWSRAVGCETECVSELQRHPVAHATGSELPFVANDERHCPGSLYR
jgi:hypothetical protein